MKPQFIPDTKQKWLQITGIVYKQQDTAVRFQVGEVLNKKNARESLRLMILEGEIFLICWGVKNYRTDNKAEGILTNFEP